MSLSREHVERVGQGAIWPLVDLVNRNDPQRLTAVLLTDNQPAPSQDQTDYLLHVAARQGKAQCTAVLLRCPNANVNWQRKGTTAVHLACYHGYEDLLRILLANRADVHVRNKYNETPAAAAAVRLKSLSTGSPEHQAVTRCLQLLAAANDSQQTSETTSDAASAESADRIADEPSLDTDTQASLGIASKRAPSATATT